MQVESKLNKLNITELENYIAAYASDTVISRANNIFPELVSSKGNYFVFNYQGQAARPYEIYVYKIGKDLITSCSCPFDYEDLCKHSVAAMQYLIDENKPKLNRKKKTQTEVSIELANGLLDKELLKNIAQNSATLDTYGNHKAIIKSRQTNKLVTKVGTWQARTQTFQFDDTTNQLHVSCNCNTPDIEKYCGHVTKAINKIFQIFGPNAFAKEYKKLRIAEFLASKGFPANFKHKNFFTFSVGVKGFKVEEKIKGLVYDLEKAKENLIPKINDVDISAISSANLLKQKTHGLGFCLMSYSYHSTINFVPFIGKFKKNTQELGTNFEIIDDYNLLFAMPMLDNKEKELVMQAHDIVRADVAWRTYDPIPSDLNHKFKTLLPALHSYPTLVQQGKTFTLKNTQPVKIIEQGVHFIFELKKDAEMFTLQLKLFLNGKEYDVQDRLLNIQSCFCIYRDVVYTYPNQLNFQRLIPFLRKGKIYFLKQNADKMFAEIIQPLSRHFKIETKTLTVKKTIDSAKLKKQLYISDYQGEAIVFKPAVLYNNKIVHVSTQEKIYDYEQGKIQARDEQYDNEFINFIRNLHPFFEDQEDTFWLPPEELVKDLWLLTAIEKLKESDVEVFGAKDLKSFKYNLNQPTTSMSLKSGMDWFDVALELKYGDQTVSLKDVRKAIVKKQNYVQLKDGTLGLLPAEWIQKFSKYFKSGTVNNDHIQVSNFQFNLLDDLTQELETKPDFLLELLDKKKRLQNLKTNIKVGAIRTLKATLRDYQKEGVKWLTFLHENKLGGCLADDMGLGKTIQVIALFAMLKSKKKVNKPHLVVAPTSLIFNWMNELEKFCPSLKVVAYTGADRAKLRKDFNKYDVILTTYGSVYKDIIEIKDFQFSYVVLDESQAIKNPTSKRYKAIKLLIADHRLALTGTPIENNTFDLYAQMNFLNPGLLGSMEHFKTNFSKPIDKEQDEDSSVLLSEMIHPFLLRRTKEKVAKELPAKTESVMYCEMSPAQQKVYEAFKNKYRDYILAKMESEGESKSQFYVLEGLTKLRQICNSPALLNDEEDYGSSSIKLDMLLEQIKDKASKHKILVFSQFTSMLSLIKERLDGEKIKYEYLDGRTRKREDKVKNFQENDDMRVFLISLKAGGVGLNLTKADYVFLVDPWWNPAVENQAIDRCYRIGQTQKVMAYRMICRDTIEEKIVQIQQNKKSISNSIIKVDATKKSFNKNQIKELFA